MSCARRIGPSFGPSGLAVVGSRPTATWCEAAGQARYPGHAGGIGAWAGIQTDGNPDGVSATTVVPLISCVRHRAGVRPDGVWPDSPVASGESGCRGEGQPIVLSEFSRGLASVGAPMLSRTLCDWQPLSRWLAMAMVSAVAMALVLVCERQMGPRASRRADQGTQPWEETPRHVVARVSIWSNTAHTGEDHQLTSTDNAGAPVAEATEQGPLPPISTTEPARIRSETILAASHRSSQRF